MFFGKFHRMFETIPSTYHWFVTVSNLFQHVAIGFKQLFSIPSLFEHLTSGFKQLSNLSRDFTTDSYQIQRCVNIRPLFSKQLPNLFQHVPLAFTYHFACLAASRGGGSIISFQFPALVFISFSFR